MNLNDFRKKNNDFITTEETNVYFNDLENKLIEKINEASYVIGCVAWLTNKKIIKALEKKEGVKIIIQKEKFLKRDYNYYICFNKYYVNLRKGYKSLPNLFNNIDNINVEENSPMFQICNKKLSDDTDLDGIRCFGYANMRNKPLMHHKFMVFLDKDMVPYGIWTGSYNFTNNANRCLDNVLYTSNITLIEKYIEEFEQLLFLSERLNWNSFEPNENV
jgi:hypothetical protein